MISNNYVYSDNLENLINFLEDPCSNESIIDFKLEDQVIYKNFIFDTVQTIFSHGYQINDSKEYLAYLETKYQYEVITVKSVSHNISFAFIFNYLGKCQYIVFKSININDSIIRSNYQLVNYIIENPDSTLKVYDWFKTNENNKLSFSNVENRKKQILKKSFQNGYDIVCDDWYAIFLVTTGNYLHTITIKSKIDENFINIKFIFVENQWCLFGIEDDRIHCNW
jgi:hypothetical protein